MVYISSFRARLGTSQPSACCLLPVVFLLYHRINNTKHTSCHQQQRFNTNMSHSHQHCGSHGWDFAENLDERNEACDQESRSNNEHGSVASDDTASLDEESFTSDDDVSSDDDSVSSYNNGDSSGISEEGSADTDDSSFFTETSDGDGEVIFRLERNDPRLTEIIINYHDDWFPTNEREWFNLGSILATNTQLTHLGILNTYDGQAISRADEIGFYNGLQYNRSIHKLHFTGPLDGVFSFLCPTNNFWEENDNLSTLELNAFELSRREMRLLSSVIAKIKNLTSLGITHCSSTDGQCFFGEDADLFECLICALGNMNHSLTRIHLQGNAIGSSAMNKLIRTIQQCHPDLDELCLQENNIGYLSCNALGSLLRDPTSRLISLDLWSCSMKDDCAFLLADALKQNRSLQFMNLRNNNFTEDGWKSFSTLLCNKTSIKDTFSSNHTLSCHDAVCGDVPNELVEYLALNHFFEDKRTVAITKVVKFHMSELLLMDVTLLPHVLASIGKEKSLFSTLFIIVCSTQELFQGVTSRATKMSVTLIA